MKKFFIVFSGFVAAVLAGCATSANRAAEITVIKDSASKGGQEASARLTEPGSKPEPTQSPEGGRDGRDKVIGRKRIVGLTEWMALFTLDAYVRAKFDRVPRADSLNPPNWMYKVPIFNLIDEKETLDQSRERFKDAQYRIEIVPSLEGKRWQDIPEGTVVIRVFELGNDSPWLGIDQSQKLVVLSPGLTDTDFSRFPTAEELRRLYETGEPDPALASESP